MKVALCSVLSDNFVVGFIVMYKSLRKHNPRWDFPVIIFSDDENCILSEEARHLVSRHCPNVIFVDIDKQNYIQIHEYAENVLMTPKRLRAAFYILEAFLLENYDLVISLDSDMLILGSLDLLLADKENFSAVRAREARTNEPVAFVNTGLMCIGKNYLRKTIFKQFVHALTTRKPLPGSGKADQAIINLFFNNRQIRFLPGIFNYTKRTLYKEWLGPKEDGPTLSEYLRTRAVKILHYVGEKPWSPKYVISERNYREAEDLWMSHLFNSVDKDGLMWLYQQHRAEEYEMREKMDYIIKGLDSKSSKKINDISLHWDKALRKML